MFIKAKILPFVLAAGLAAPLTSFASWGEHESYMAGSEPELSMKSRAEVAEELRQAKLDPSWKARAKRGIQESGVWHQESNETSKTRAQVTQEMRAQSPEEKAYFERLYWGS